MKTYMSLCAYTDLDQPNRTYAIREGYNLERDQKWHVKQNQKISMRLSETPNASATVVVENGGPGIILLHGHSFVGEFTLPIAPSSFVVLSNINAHSGLELSGHEESNVRVISFCVQ